MSLKRHGTTVAISAALAALSLAMMSCAGMRAMMTRSLDETAAARVLAVNGEHEGRRMNPEGNSEDLAISQDMDLKTADLVLGSDDDGSSMLLDVGRGNHARFIAADFVLRSPLGEDSELFSVVLEMGSVEYNIADGADRRFELMDTNKNRVLVDERNARFFVHCDDETFRIFVREGEVEFTNEVAELETTIAAGSGLSVDEDAKVSKLDAGSEWAAGLEWAAGPPEAEVSE